MDFAQKLTALMEIAGLTNSKVARTIRVDPSLVSRWRGGTRQPLGNSAILLQLSACLAAGVATRHQQAQLARLLGGGAERRTRQELTEDIFAWLGEAGEAPAAGGAPAPAAGEAPATAELAFSNAFAGPEGRRLTVIQMLEQFDPTQADAAVMFYSSDPIGWIEADIATRKAVLAESPHLFDNVSTVKLIVHSNAGSEEYLGLLHYVLPFLKNGTIQIAQALRYRKELFTSTILIAGQHVAAASHGFAGSENFMTNVYTDPAFVHKLTRDYNRLFARCERIHTVEQDVTMADIIDEEAKMFLFGEDITFLGNALLSVAMPPALLAEVLGERLPTGRGQAGVVRIHLRQFEEFLEGQALCMNVPLYRPEEVEAGAAYTIGMKEGQGVTLDVPRYLQVLENLLALMKKHPRFAVRVIERLPHEHSLMLQPNAQIHLLRTTAPNTLYTSRQPGMLGAFKTFLEQKFGETKMGQTERLMQLERLRAHIQMLRGYLAGG